MTEYLTNYMNTVSERLDGCSDAQELDSILSEHMDKDSLHATRKNSTFSCDNDVCNSAWPYSWLEC